jgi:uncharacterized protein
VSRPALLDVNLLIALFEPGHPHHEVAHDWFADNQKNGWATCALTQNGFVRILSNPKQGVALNRVVDLLNHLGRFCASKHHAFWPDSISLTDRKIFNPSLFGGHRQISDIYLLGLAKKNGGHLATLDASIPLGAVVGATKDHLSVIST